MDNRKRIIKAKLLESSLSRLWKTMQERDTGIITAFRGEYSHEENLNRNDALVVDLRRYFDVTSIKGSYIENYGEPEAEARSENVFFVAVPDDNNYIKKYSISLKKKLMDLGKKYEQDSVFYIPVGGTVGILIGTKEGVWPGLNVEKEFDHPIFGKSGQFYSSIKGRPFVFQNKINEQYRCDGPRGFFGEWCRYLQTCKYDKKNERPK